MRIALDGMGGDHAPGPNVDGAVAAVQADPELRVSLVGQPDALTDLLRPHAALSDRITIVPADDVVGMHEKPTDALRKKPNSSIAVCWQLMASREVDAVVSAGNTGAVVASGLRTRLFLKGIKRPGIAVVLPTAAGRAVLVDVGANPAARPEHLYQYGLMGSIYAREFLGVESPRVGLMNIGSEDGKGNDLYRETHAFLLESSLRDAYVGNVEGRGLYKGEADVLICEGFVGNVVLKVSEGMAEFLVRMVASEVLDALEGEKAVAMKTFERLARRLQYSETGGAPLLGIDGVCIICHGSSDDRSITNALRMATTLKSKQINSKITSALARAGHIPEQSVGS